MEDYYKFYLIKYIVSEINKNWSLKAISFNLNQYSEIEKVMKTYEVEEKNDAIGG